MSVSKRRLLFVAFCLNFCECAPSSWTVVVPTSVKGLVGSCVVIPCSFDYPRPENTVTQFTGIWVDGSSHMIYHPDQKKVRGEYHNRTELLGDLQHKNCSLKIEPLQESDTGPFHFRIEIKNFNNYSYKDKPVSITTTTELEPLHFSMKEEVLLGDSVSAICSVSHTCPSSPPGFTWTRSGQQVQQQTLEDGLWTTTSTLTFQPNRTDHSKSLQCTVTYRGGRQQSARKVLSVKYAPQIKNSSSCFSEGHQVRCVCMAESNPPCAVHLLLADVMLPNIKIEKYGLLTIATVQDDVGLIKSIRCVANNTVGKAELMMSLPNSNIYIYIGIGVGAAVLILTAFVVVGVARKCSRSRQACASTSLKKNNDIGLETPQYVAAISSRTRKEPNDLHCPGHFASEHTYSNTEEIFDPDDDAVYANC